MNDIEMTPGDPGYPVDHNEIQVAPMQEINEESSDKSEKSEEKEENQVEFE